MEDPERLDVGAWRLRSRTVRFGVGAVVLLLGAAALRLVGFPAPSPSEPVSAPVSSARPDRTGWPTQGEIGDGTLYAVADGVVHRIDVASGELSSTGVRRDPIDTRLTPMLDGVLVWSTFDGKPVFVGRGPAGPSSVGGALRSGDLFLAGGNETVWAATVGDSRADEATTWRLVDRDGRVEAEVEVVGTAAPDGSGGLLAVLDDGLQRVHPRPRGPLEDGELLAAGPDGYLTRTCTDDGRCTALLHERSTGEPRPVGLSPPAHATPGVLSPGNRFVTLSVLGEPDAAVQVRALDSPRVLREFGINGPVGGSAVWLSDHWLALATGNGGIVLYDADADQAVRPDLPLTTNVQQLVGRPAV